MQHRFYFRTISQKLFRNVWERYRVLLREIFSWPFPSLSQMAMLMILPQNKRTNRVQQIESTCFRSEFSMLWSYILMIYLLSNTRKKTIKHLLLNCFNFFLTWQEKSTCRILEKKFFLRKESDQSEELKWDIVQLIVKKFQSKLSRENFCRTFFENIKVEKFIMVAWLFQLNFFIIIFEYRRAPNACLMRRYVAMIGMS